MHLARELEKMSCEERDVLGSLAECRNPERHDVEAIEEVRTKSARLDLLFEGLVGGRDHAHVDLDRRAAADAFELTLLQHPQQLRLHRGRHVADLVEKQRAAMRALELARLVFVAP